MSIEFIIYLSIVAIFVVLVRHLPSAIKKEETVKDQPSLDMLGVSGADNLMSAPTAEASDLSVDDVFVDAGETASDEAPVIDVALQEPPIKISTDEKAKSLEAFFSATSGDFDELGDSALVKRDGMAGSFASSGQDFGANSTHQSSPPLSKINNPNPTRTTSKKNFLESGLSAVKGFMSKAKPKKESQLNNSAQPNIKNNPVTFPEQKNISDGDKFFASGDLIRAEDSYLRAVAINPKDPKIYNRLGAIYLKNKNFKEALESFEAARDLDGGRASRHYNVALAAYESKDFSTAQNAIDQALKLDADSANYKQLKDLIDTSI